MPDASTGLLVDLVEVDIVIAHRGERLHRDVHEPEADRSRPQRACHVSAASSCRSRRHRTGPPTDDRKAALRAAFASSRSLVCNDTRQTWFSFASTNVSVYAVLPPRPANTQMIAAEHRASEGADDRAREPRAAATHRRGDQAHERTADDCADDGADGSADRSEPRRSFGVRVTGVVPLGCPTREAVRARRGRAERRRPRDLRARPLPRGPGRRRRSPPSRCARARRARAARPRRRRAP